MTSAIGAGSEILVEAPPGAFATVTLNRLAKRNCVTLAMWHALGEIFLDLGRRPEVRGVVLTGAGGQFCAGADIGEFPQVRADQAGAVAYEEAVRHAELAIADCPKPVIAQISGYAVGGGCGLALACDFRIADRTTRMGIPAARLGIVYSPLECRFLMNQVGVANAKRVLYSGTLFPADEAAALGLIDILAEDAAAATGELAERLAGNAPISIAGSKLILNALARETLDETMPAIESIQRRAVESSDYREAARAFIEKRTPSFRGE